MLYFFLVSNVELDVQCPRNKRRVVKCTNTLGLFPCDLSTTYQFIVLRNQPYKQIKTKPFLAPTPPQHSLT